MSERMDERYGLDTPQEREREATDLRKKYEALEKERDQYRALIELACVDVIFFHSQEHGPFLQAEGPQLIEAIGFSVLVNDLFYPAADAEGFDISEAIPLRDVFRKDGMEGIIRWVQQKRDNLPLRPHVEKRVREREDLRKENADLKAQVERLSAPVSDEEPDTCDGCEKPLREDEGHETEDMVMLCDECWQGMLDDPDCHSEECQCAACIASRATPAKGQL